MESRKDPPDLHRCPFCVYGSKSFLSILRHVGEHNRGLQSDSDRISCHNKTPENYKCEKCDFETNLKILITHHFSANHKEPKKHYSQFRNNVVTQCGFCDFQTYSVLLLLKHYLECDKRNDFGKDESDETHKIINWLECGQCPFKTQSKYTLKQHIQFLHSTNFTLLECEKCAFKTKYMNSLRLHMQMKHANSKSLQWFRCGKCHYKTKWRACLTKHVANVHTDSANIVWYRCEMCPYKTKSNTYLKRHVTNIHTDSTNVMWHYCGKCSYKAKQKYMIKRHHKKCSKPTELENIHWYVHCDKCQYKTKSISNLKKHAAIHLVSVKNSWDQRNKSSSLRTYCSKTFIRNRQNRMTTEGRFAEEVGRK